MAQTGEVTRLLVAYRDGDREAFDRLVPLVYDDLRRIAHARLRGGRNQTLNTTGLVNEAWLRLVDRDHVEWRDRDHFLCVCARAMRQIVVSNARRRNAEKRGGKQSPGTLEESRVPAARVEIEQILALDQALERLAARSDRLARIVECRHFAGLTGEETARALGLSSRTVEREWVRARAWLREDLGGSVETV